MARADCVVPKNNLTNKFKHWFSICNLENNKPTFRHILVVMCWSCCEHISSLFCRWHYSSTLFFFCSCTEHTAVLRGYKENPSLHLTSPWNFSWKVTFMNLKKLLSFHRKVSLLVGMLMSQGPCFERKVVTQARAGSCGVGAHTREIPTSKSPISAKAGSDV